MKSNLLTYKYSTEAQTSRFVVISSVRGVPSDSTPITHPPLPPPVPPLGRLRVLSLSLCLSLSLSLSHTHTHTQYVLHCCLHPLATGVVKSTCSYVPRCWYDSILHLWSVCMRFYICGLFVCNACRVYNDTRVRVNVCTLYLSLPSASRSSSEHEKFQTLRAPDNRFRDTSPDAERLRVAGSTGAGESINKKLRLGACSTPGP